MDMEVTAYMSMYHAMNAQNDKRPFSKKTLKRIGTFAKPHKVMLGWFLLLSVVTAALAVATPVLAGRVVDAIVDGASKDVVYQLAALIAVIAIVEAGLGLVARWLSARIGEGLILDLRTSVFDHVQRMPIAFFTRTHTGALVSRLNNDVIGAQRAFSDTLSGVVGNVVTLVLTLVVMIGISWQITGLALLLLPAFVLPARRMGSRLARLEREAANHNAVMSTQATERFSAPGATLIKLFGRPARESAEFAMRAGRVRDIGVRTAMVQAVFVTALTLASALALALVYGLGGFFALTGQLDPGDVVALALLLTRLYAPLTALASARVEVMSALVSFERVFEVLDLKPLISEKPDAVAVPEGPVAVELDDVRFAYPSADKVSLASLEEVAKLDSRGGVECCTASASAPSPVRWWPWWGLPAPASRRSRRWCPVSTTSTPASSGSVGPTSATCRSSRSATPWAWSPRTGTCSTRRSARTSCWPGPRPPTTSCGTACAVPGSPTWSPPCPTASTRSSANAGTGSPAASASG